MLKLVFKIYVFVKRYSAYILVILYKYAFFAPKLKFKLVRIFIEITLPYMPYMHYFIYR